MANLGNMYGPKFTFLGIGECDLDDPKTYKGADVIIVGLGGAGVAAALESIETGNSVLAIDKYETGGATKASGGVIYAGGGTSLQVEAGVKDTVENMFNYLKLETRDIVSDQTLKGYY